MRPVEINRRKLLHVSNMKPNNHGDCTLCVYGDSTCPKDESLGNKRLMCITLAEGERRTGTRVTSSFFIDDNEAAIARLVAKRLEGAL
jgi:hypothetical protein